MLLIRNGRVLDPASGMDDSCDILVEDGQIIKIGHNLEEEMFGSNKADMLQIIDATGLVVAPGLVDVHVHFRDPGFTYKEDIETGAKAAAKGGFTTVVLMANTKPAVDNEETLSYILEKGKTTGIHVETCGTVTMGMQGRELSPMEAMKEVGAVGFTDDGVPIMDEELVIKAMKMAKELDVPLSFHEENPELIKNNGIHRGKASAHFGVEGSPREAEISMIKRDLDLAISIGATINIQHISTKEGVELVRQAKKKSDKVHAEACPHHFVLNETAVIELRTMAKMNPPLREESDRLAIIEGLKDGTIDIIATDHAPHSKEEKERPITEAPSGIVGLETALSLGIMELVGKGQLSLLELMKKMSYHPANMYHLPGGKIQEGAPGDFVIFNEKDTWTVEGFLSKSWNSPFLGKTLPGVVYYTICDGTIVYQK